MFWKNTLNSRTYNIIFETAKNAFKTLKKIETLWNESNQKYGDSLAERPDVNYIFFTPIQLRMICIDYAFAALENFLEHIGYILCDDWESAGKQRHYSEKNKKLIDFPSFINKNRDPNKNYEDLQHQWKSIIQSIDLSTYNKIRNPIKHVHTEKHDIKTQILSTISANRSFNQLNEETCLALTDNDCNEFIEKVEKLITDASIFLKEHKLIFNIYSNNRREIDKKIEGRYGLFLTFLQNPFAPTLYVGSLISAKQE